MAELRKRNETDADGLPADERPTIVERMPERPGKKKATGPVRSVLDMPKESRPVDPSLREYAARFLSGELPEAIKPTASERQLQIALLWGRDQFISVQSVDAGRPLSIGDAPTASLSVPTVAGALPFVQPVADGFRLLLPADARARVLTEGRVHSGEEVARLPGAQSVDVPVRGVSYQIGLNDRVNVEFGNLQVIARYTRPQRPVARTFADRIDLNFLSTLLILLMTAIVFERMIAITDFDDEALTEDLIKTKEKFTKYVAVEEEKKPPKPDKQLSGVKEGAKPKDDEGKFGKKEAEKEKAAPSKAGAPVVDVNKREEDRKKVMNSGLIALLGGDKAGATSNILGPGGIGTGLNNSLGGIDGAAGMGDASGVGGLGARGGGAGGGGTGLGIGGLGSHGSGRGRGGSGQFDLGGKGKGETKVVPGKTTIKGGLSADEIGRIIRRHWNEIKYCYEKELNKDPNLAGKVAIFFVIDPMGDVAEARVSETTLNNSGAEQCMLSNVKRWKFRSPDGGGVVEVNYPFIFTAQ
jgi:outer membrane biosynthesis protein TonB